MCGHGGPGRAWSNWKHRYQLRGKADAAIAFFRSGGDFVYLHVEAPDECGHRQEIQNKVRAIEYLDQRILKKVWDYLENTGEPYRILVLPDHPTPLALRHTRSPVPYMICEGDRAGIRSCFGGIQ